VKRLRSEEGKKKDEKSLIKLAANEYNLTITGHKVKILKELLDIWGSQEIEARLKVFAQYQQKPVKDRRYPLGNTFDAFARKFDLFKDSAMLEIRLAAEKRWDQEYRNQGAANAGVGKKQSDGCIRYETFPKNSDEEEPKEEFDLVKWNLGKIAGNEKFIENKAQWIDKYEEVSKKNGKPPKDYLDPVSFKRYQIFMRDVRDAEAQIKELRAEIAVEQLKRGGNFTHEYL